MQTQTDPHTCSQIKRHTNGQFLLWCRVLGQDVSTRTLPGLPFHRGQAQFPLGLLQPALHSSNSTTQKGARALTLGSKDTEDSQCQALWGGGCRRQSAPNQQPAEVSHLRDMAPVPLGGDRSQSGTNTWGNSASLKTVFSEGKDITF